MEHEDFSLLDSLHTSNTIHCIEIYTKSHMIHIIFQSPIMLGCYMTNRVVVMDVVSGYRLDSDIERRLVVNCSLSHAYWREYQSYLNRAQYVAKKVGENVFTD